MHFKKIKSLWHVDRLRHTLIFKLKTYQFDKNFKSLKWWFYFPQWNTPVLQIQPAFVSATTCKQTLNMLMTSYGTSPGLCITVQSSYLMRFYWNKSNQRKKKWTYINRNMSGHTVQSLYQFHSLYCGKGSLSQILLAGRTFMNYDLVPLMQTGLRDRMKKKQERTWESLSGTPNRTHRQQIQWGSWISEWFPSLTSQLLTAPSSDQTNTHTGTSRQNLNIK